MKLFNNIVLHSKKSIFLFFLLALSFGCQTDNEKLNKVPFVPVNFEVNLQLPEGQPLQVIGGFAVFQNQGVKGIIVHRVSDISFRAFDLACPHLFPQECATPMDISDFPVLDCDCANDGVEYNVFEGFGERDVFNPETDKDEKVITELEEYTAILGGNVVRITN